MSERIVRSSLLPGGDLVAAVLNREVMGLADRGGASNLVGDRWADVSAEYAATWIGSNRPIPDADKGPLRVERIERLDAIPAVAALASKRGLQNPDLLLVGERNGRPVVQAADAKFSVETARAKQVSVEVLANLLGLRGALPHVLGAIPEDADLVPGVFVSPDFPLTHLMLRRRHGIMRTTVRADEVALAPVDPDTFFAPLEGVRVMRPLADVDALPTTIDESVLAGLYYFRLARAAVGFWLDATKPLLLFEDRPEVDESVVAAEAAARATRARSAFELIVRWNEDVQTIRNQRSAVDQAAGLPLYNKELRVQVAALAAGAGVEPPSLNQVRRRVGAWWRGELRHRVGPLSPVATDLPKALEALAQAGTDLAPRLPGEVERVVNELIAASADGRLVAAEQAAVG
ncbi:MAG: hypothetical protein IT337_14340 [Thermomicrobiales bacterium]|nr:hypothetical protein [Thermomicrobiales bacterium]